MTKYKNLNILKEITKDMKDIVVPSFTLIDFSYFDLYTSYNDKELEKRLQTFYKEHIKTGGKYILRSSALKSEDGDVMGAGLYESERLEENTFACFYQTILFIYESFYTPQAIQERENQNLADDKLEIILQDYIQGHYSNYNNAESKGFCNSILQGNNKLIHIDIHNHPILLKGDELIESKRERFWDMEEMFFRCDDSDKYREMFAYPFDIYQVWDIPFIGLGYIIKDIKKQYKKEFQIEFSYCNHIFYIYQIRPLPQVYKKEINVTVPKEKELFSIPFPFKKEKTKVYPSYHWYRYKERFYITDNSHSASVKGSFYLEKFTENLPEVICFQEHSLIDHWHLQSIALQKNKLVLEAYPNWEKIDQLKDFQSFYIVGDWEKMRFYKNEEIEKIDKKRVLAFIEGYLNWCDYSYDREVFKGEMLMAGKCEQRYRGLNGAYKDEFKNFPDKKDIDYYLCEYQAVNDKYDIKYTYWKFYITEKG